jgi:sugar lactone lactonase YvrE
MMNFTCLLDIRCGLGESPVWDDRRELLFFVDAISPAIHAVRLDGTGLQTWPMPKPVGSIGLAESGRLIVALWHDLVLFDPDTGGLTQFAKLADEPDTNRLNDGKVGPDGAFWVGTIVLSMPRRPVGSLYRLTGNGQVERKATGYGVSNGLAFSPDGGTMFHSDSFSKVLSIDRWTLDPTTGEIAGRTRIAVLDQKTGFPDGAACDVDGHYWSAGVFGGRLNRFTSTGVLIASYPVPVPAPTMPCYCGPDLRTLVLTSLRESSGAIKIAPNPQSGSLFVARAPAAGTPVGRMQGL